MNFATIDAALPEDLADHIARVAHRSNIAPIMEHITANDENTLIVSDFDQAIRKGASNIKEFMVNKYRDDVTVIIDDRLDWYTIAFLFPKTSRFALFHHYAEWHTCDQFLIDGTYTDTTFHIQRYVYVDRRGEYHIECDDIKTYIPFQAIKPDIDNITFDFSGVGSRVWENPKEILLAFNKVEYGDE